MIFVVICLFASCPSGTSGNRKCTTGCSFRDAAAISPDRCAISISPTQKDITPSIVIQSVTASLEESSAAFVTSAILPVNAP